MIIILIVICNNIWCIGIWLIFWIQLMIIMLLMKENFQLCKNYCVISLIIYLNKVMLKMVINRLKLVVEIIIVD